MKIKKAFGFDPGASRDVGILFLEEISKTLDNGSCPGYHNAVVIIGDENETDRNDGGQLNSALHHR